MLAEIGICIKLRSPDYTLYSGFMPKACILLFLKCHIYILKVYVSDLMFSAMILSWVKYLRLKTVGKITHPFTLTMQTMILWPHLDTESSLAVWCFIWSSDITVLSIHKHISVWFFSIIVTCCTMMDAQESHTSAANYLLYNCMRVILHDHLSYAISCYM